MNDLVTDLPIWTDCPFRERVPDNIEIRRGVMFGLDTLVLWDSRGQRHVDLHAGDLGIDDPAFDWSRILEPALSMLAAAQRLRA
jgi:hypothetical protein